MSRTWFLALLLAAGCSGKPRPLRLFAAASMAESVAEAVRAYEAAGGGKVQISLASSSTLARQVLAGARADVFISANAAWMDRLEEQGRVVAGTRRNLLGNRLVLIAPARSSWPAGLVDLKKPGSWRLALGDPGHVPAGLYAKEALKSLGIWNSVEGRLLPAMDARAALAYVDRGEAECGIVYRTDARVGVRTRIVTELPSRSHAPIRYPAAVLAGAREEPARELLDFLAAEASTAIWKRHGFEL